VWSEPLALFRSSGEWTDEHVAYLATARKVPPEVVKVRIGRLLSRADQPDGVWAKLELNRLRDEAAAAKWTTRHRPRSATLTGADRHSAWLAALERGDASKNPVVEDRDLLVLASAWEVSIDAAMVRAGRALMDGKEAADDLAAQLRATDAGRRAAIEAASQVKLTLQEARMLGRYFALESERWVTAGGVAYRGVDPAEEAMVLVGRKFMRDEVKLGRGRPKALQKLLDDARRDEALLEAWRGDANWADRDTQLYAHVMRRANRLRKGPSSSHAFLKPVRPEHHGGSREAALELGRVGLPSSEARDEIAIERRVQQWLRKEEYMLLLAAWNGERDPDEEVPRMLAAGQETDLFVLRDRIVAAAVAAAEDAFAEGGPFENEPRSAIDLLASAWSEQRAYNQNWAPVDIKELLGASILLEKMPPAAARTDWLKSADIFRAYNQLVSESCFPRAFVESGWRLADVSQHADNTEMSFRTALEAAIVSAVTKSDGPDPAALQAEREAAGYGWDECMKAFDESPRWFLDDASFIAELRNTTISDVAEWMGHRLLKGKEDDIEYAYVQDRIEEQALFRTEAFDQPYVILVLQGGGAKAAYQVGVFEALEAQGLSPSWVLGISSGALNAAAIAGNPPSRRSEALHEMWDKLTNKWEMSPYFPESMKHILKLTGAFSQLMYKPNFYFPHGLPNMMFQPGTDGAVSDFNNAPLRGLMNEVCDWSRVRREAVIHRRTRWSRRRSRTPTRLTVGTTKVKTGEFVWWDSASADLDVDHVLASGAMPPGAPAVRLDDELYWDGGVVGNNPLEPVLAEMLNGTMNGREVLVVFVDLWGSEDWLPRTKKEVELRQQQLDFTGRVDASIERFRLGLLLEVEKRRRRPALGLDERPWRPRRRGYGTIDPRSLTILRIENARNPALGMYDAMDFSVDSLDTRRQAGFDDMKTALDESDWRRATGASDIGGSIHHYRRGRLVSVTPAVDTEQIPEEYRNT